MAAVAAATAAAAEAAEAVGKSGVTHFGIMPYEAPLPPGGGASLFITPMEG